MSGAPRADFTGVVVAAGASHRFGGGPPKQFRPVGSRPEATVLDRSLATILANPAVRGAVVVLAAAELDGARGRELVRRPGVLAVVAGGTTRAASVRAGLRAAGSSPFVLVHDAARPLASAELVEAVVSATRRHGAAIPGLDVADTVKAVALDDAGELWVRQTVERGGLRLAQTPQGARADWLTAALDDAERAGVAVTDECAALERAGHRVAVVAGDPLNRKITTSEDLAWVRRQLAGDEAGLRVGSGFDVHRFGADRALVLGGVEFPGEPGLVGHSDADVVLHAAMDALLGAAGLDDIGSLFPPDDPEFAGAASSGLAAQVARRVAGAGYEPVNLDLTLLAERPRIRSRVDEMRRAIGRSLGMEPSRIALKATTLEGLGALGRSEGVACQAVALLRRTRAS